MSERIDIVKGVSGQRIYFDPAMCGDPAGRGRPTSTPSVLIKDSAGNTVTAAATTYVTQDSVATTIKAATSVSAGDKTATLTSAAGAAVGVTYLLTNAAAQREWVRLVGANASTGVVEFGEPVEHDYAAADTFVGCRFYYTLQAAEVDELVELYRARATYAVGGRSFVLEVPFDVVLTQLPNLLTAEFIKRRRPDIMAQQPSVSLGDDLEDLREEAWALVRRGIRQVATSRNEWRPALLRTPEDVDQWAMAEFDKIAWRNGLRVLRGEWAGEAAMRYLDEEIDLAKTRALSSLTFMDLEEDDSRGTEDTHPARAALRR